MGPVDGPVYTSPPPTLLGGGSGMDAIVGGVLAFDGDCLYLVSGEIEYPVVWPHGATWRTDPPQVAIRDQLIEPGRYVSGEGGYVPLVREDLERAAGPEVAGAAMSCAGPTAEIAYFNEGSRVTSE
jgi:hypothetical protein